MSNSEGPPRPTPRRLDRRLLALGVHSLSRFDTALGDVVSRHGLPPLWARRPGFPTLIRIILEQQVSLASAGAMYGRLEQALGRVRPETTLECGRSGLRGLGLTRQKSDYCLAVADAIRTGRLNLTRVARAPEPAAREELQRIRGIGPWTTDIYLLMALRRPDVWPTGDIALMTAIQRLRHLRERPTVHEATELARGWRPWRAVAARILWHGYLEGSLKRAPAGSGGRGPMMAAPDQQSP